jgi:hypothetical protein
MDRRHFIKVVGGTGATMALGSLAQAGQLHPDMDDAHVSRYLRSLIPSREQVDNFVHGRQGPEKLSRNQGWVFDGELGWILCDSVRPRSVDGSKGFYQYEADGARKVVNFSDKPCRIHTYGNSFTHCDQVSDGETWQEYLAAHLQEPIRNYGVGGYGVYQAFRRMLRVERASPAKYVILNIWDDDHYRNLDSWRAIRFGHRTPCGYTLPYLRVNVREDQCEQIENLCHEPEDVYRLCDVDFVRRTFMGDPVLHLALCTRGGAKATQKLLMSISNSFGISDEKILALRSAEAIRKIHTEAALCATRNIVTWTEQFVEKTRKKLMLVLSFGQGNIARELQGEPRFDQSFVEWLKGKAYPIIDMRDCFRADYAQFKPDVNTYLKRYYIGHHNPAGNFFTAWALKNQLVRWLDPPPAPYR